MDSEVGAVLAAFGLDAAGATARPAPTGLIQRTDLVELRDGRRLVVQRMHPIFAPEVVEDIDAITAHLEARGLATPRPLRTPAGALTHTDAVGRHWRILTFLPGHTVDRVDGPARAAEGGRLVQAFHAALAGWQRPFRFARAGVHDTAAHLGRLERALAGARPADVPGYDRLAPLAERILAEARPLPPLGDLPRRVTHGDLKISNVLFADGAPTRAVALLDLDTLGRLPLAYELGDAWRSWCNPLGEDVEDTRFDLEILGAAAEGYGAGGAHGLEPAEAASLVPGIQTVAVELAARFCVDAFEDRYFGWDASRFPSRREHNRVRAAGQLALARALAAVRSEAEALVRRGLRLSSEAG